MDWGAGRAFVATCGDQLHEDVTPAQRVFICKTNPWSRFTSGKCAVYGQIKNGPLESQAVAKAEQQSEK